MKSLIEYIQEKLGIIDPDMPIMEMSTIDKKAKLGKSFYRIALHGPAVGDRPYPHIHIYDPKDKFPYKNFNFEISLIDLLCYDELNLICQQDKQNDINIKNRKNCSWNGYRKMRDDFEDWLSEPCIGIPGNFKDNLDALIWSYNNEAPDNDDRNPLLDYIKDQGKKVLPKYQKYFKSE